MHYHLGPYTDAIPSSPPTAAAMSSSPAGPFLSPSRTGRRKERRNPSVTPRRFGRFFTPRSAMPGGVCIRRPLERIDSSAVNRQPISPQSLASDPITADAMCSSPTERVTRATDAAKRRCPDTPMQALKKRRGYVMDDVALPPLSIPGFPQEEVDEVKSANIQDASWLSRQGPDALGDRRKATLNLFFKASRSGGLRNLEEKSAPTTPDVVSADISAHSTLEGYQPKPIRKFRNRGFESQLLNREHGFSAQPAARHLATPACDPRTETASYYSRNNDIHNCASYTGQGNTIPFSLASCHNAPVTAIGDEQGYVRLFNTTESSEMADAKVDIHISAHDNAIMDLAFSQDDMRLATACGDRTGKIIDVATQTVAFELAGGHCDSLRQIAFQAGQANGSTLATSDRAGRIQIWDLRCSPMPVNCFSTVTPDGVMHRNTDIETMFGKTVNTFDNAHERRNNGSTSSASVTAIQWLPAGREHLLLSASEANASIKLWDTRYIKPRRQQAETPLAVTPEPRGHAWRSYGMTSMALSSDAARLYAVCKDSTVYAYSTAHLILGHAPALEDNATKRKPSGSQGLGPLFGFKHDLFRAQSFYVKCAIRPSLTAGGPELLAVGSTDSCAVLFPTDERYMRSAWSRNSHILDPSSSAPASTSASFSSSAPPPPTPAQASANPFFSFSCSTPSAASGAGSASSIPIFRSGTALVRGHSREVTTLSWSHEGKLVTASDDYVVRQWQSGGDTARHLRTVGEFGGERHLAGWADVGADWDVDDDE